MQGVFITGTDTGVGKTTVAVALIHCLSRSLRTGAYKPVASGAEATPSGPVWTDAEHLQAAVAAGLQRDIPDAWICPQRFVAPLAPPVAARLEGREVDAGLLRSGIAPWAGRVEAIVVEGAGGWLAPLTETESVADVARDFGLPVLVVARLGLGTLNHTLLTLEAIERRGLKVAGIVMNEAEPRNRDNRQSQAEVGNPDELARRCAVPILAVCPWRADTDLLRDDAFRKMDWTKILGQFSPAILS